MPKKNEEEFKYDPEAEENTKKYRLPFALCKKYGIATESWWTPTNAWEALKSGGYIGNVSQEYKDYFENLKKESNKRARERQKRKKQQLNDPKHNPDKNYIHKDGAIAGALKGTPMTFEQADSGNVNPYYMKGIGYAFNCQTCVATYIARRQGYDVRALPNLNNKNIYSLSYNTNLAYVNAKKQAKPKGTGTTMWLEQTIKQGEIYSVEFCWKGKRQGHIITCERDKTGSLRLYDPQTNKIYKNQDMKSYFARTTDVEITNLTNVKINERFCDSIMKKEK